MNKELEANTTLSHYRIEGKLGAGGMGEVYLAQDTKLDRKVALKILPPEFAEDKERMSRFVREGKSASGLNHPNIITIHEIAESNGIHFIATEFIDGKTLNEYLKNNPLDYKSALEIAIQIASALDEAHSAGIVHRDIKPDNVMIRHNGLVKILDFGIAKLSAPTSTDAEAATAIKSGTTPGMIIGTANYMSPEQAKGAEVNAQTDIFSFGVVLYEMISGHLPFEGETAMEMIGAILHKEPKPLKLEVPSEIKTIVGKCLRKERDERYQTVKDVLADLKQLQTRLLVKAELERTSAPNKEAETQIFKADTVEASRKDAQTNSVAVLPFTNMSADEDNEYFCDGLAEELLNALSKIDDLKVAARTSAFSFKGRNANASEIGEKLNVKNVLEGSVRKSGGKLRITVQLINASDGYHLWSERYDREMKDIFDVQDEIALAVVDALKLKLFGDEKEALLKHYTDNTEVYELYLKGRFFWSKLSPAGLEKAIEYFNEAISIEPNFALAYAGLADSYEILSQISAVPVRETMPKAREFAEKALSLDPNLAEAHVSLGLVLADYDYDFAAAETHYKTAIRLNPKNPTAHQLYGQLLAQLGRHEEAEGEFHQAIKIDPLSILFNWHYGFGLFEARRYDEAIAQLEKTFEMDSGFLLTQWVFAVIHQACGDYAKAAESFAKFYELQGNPEDAARVRKSFAEGGWSGFVRMMTGEQQPADVTAYLTATLHSSLGEKETAFVELEKAYSNREALLPLIKIDPRVDSLRDDPRFAKMLNRLGFPPEKAKQTDESLEARTISISDLGMRNADSESEAEPTTNPKSKTQNPKSKWWLFGLLGLIVLVGGFFGYKYFTPTKQIESIAVMPFVNESGNADVEYLSDGMTETLIGSLSQLPNLNVKPRSSVFRYKGKETDPQTISKDLNVQAILNGRVVQRGQDISLFVELIDISLDKVVWSETYNRKQTDLVALQADIARDVSGKIKNKLSGEEIAKVTKTYTTNPEAYQLYLKGNFYRTKYTEEGYRKGIEYYQKAIAVDPNYALAYHGIAAAYDFANGFYLSAKEAEPKAKAAAVKALELDETLAETHFLLGKIVFWYEWDWATAEREWKRANELDPTYPAYYPPYLAAMGRLEEAIKAQQVLQQRTPLDLNMNLDLAFILLQAGKHDQSIEQTRKALELDPKFWWSYQSLGLAYERKRQYPEAIAALEKARQLDVNPSSLGYLGYVYAAAGKKAEAQKTLEELKELSKKRYVSPYNIACIYAGLNDKDQAFAWLEHAYQERSFEMTLLKVETVLDNLRPDPRYKDLLKRMNLPE